MSEKKNELYRWEKISKPRVYSRSQRVTSDDDIQDWMKKVEDASGRAAAATFGTKYTSPPSHCHKSSVATRVEDVHLHDAAYIEAQELLQEWVHDKLDLDAELEFSEENWTRKTESEIKREWDHLLGEGDSPNITTPKSRSTKTPRDPYQILKEEDGSLVDQVLQNLMNKEVVEEDFIQDLGLDKADQRRDPRTKMILRHQQVKENREKREREKKRKLQEQQAHKDAQLKARQILQQEERTKALTHKKEEDAIQREMSKIRKQMELEKKLQEEQKLKEQRERDEFARKVKEEMEQQREAERRALRKEQQKAKQRESDVSARIEELNIKEATENLKLLQRCFSAWYNVVVQRHLMEGKVKATQDWKLLMKTFKSWKSYTISCQIEREAQIHQQDVKALQRKQAIAETHARVKLLRRCFVAWQLYVAQQQNDHLMSTTHDQTKNKMAAFLDAAASGKLWSARSPEGHTDRSCDQSTISGDSTARQVNDMFAGPGRPLRTPGSARSDTSSLTSRTEGTSGGRNRSHSDRTRPKQSWQLSRKDVQVTKEELSRAAAKMEAEGEKFGSETDRTSASKRSKSAFVPNNFENRHAAQQKLLENQQKQIKEQQRLIEEMQFLQKQQLLQQQITQQQLLRQQISDDTSNVSVPNSPPPGNHSNKSAAGTDRKKKQEKPQNNDRAESVSGTNQALVTSRSDKTVSSAALYEEDGKSTISKASVSSKHSKFLKSMEERAAERNRLKRDREEKRRKAEEERLARLQAEEEEKRRQEEDEKRQKIEAYRERKRQEKQLEQEKRDQQERLQQHVAIADEHRRLALMKYRGFLPWRHLVDMAHTNKEKATDHANKTLLRKVLLTWHQDVSDDLTHKRALADDMHAYILIRRSFGNWKMLGHHMVIQEEKAARHCENTLKVKVIRAWSNFAAEEKMTTWRYERLAREHNKKRVVLTAFRAWRRFPEVLREEKVREQRLSDMRKKVASLLPDFTASPATTGSSSDFFS